MRSPQPRLKAFRVVCLCVGERESFCWSLNQTMNKKGVEFEHGHETGDTDWLQTEGAATCENSLLDVAGKSVQLIDKDFEG